MATTKIEWADKVWNPVTGCTKVSEGCRNCYAELMASRFWGDRKFTDVKIHPERLGQPLDWGKPTRVFVNSMSDLFHKDVPFQFIDSVFHIIRVADRHTFLILTKRPEIMLKFIEWQKKNTVRLDWENAHKNIWLGVSVENQKTADERIPLLLQAPAAVRFVSCEPLLGPVDLWKFATREETFGSMYDHRGSYGYIPGFPKEPIKYHEGIDWVIAGGESGKNARPMHPDWVRSIRDQCDDAGVPFFFKQWGEWTYIGKQAVEDGNWINIGTTMQRVGKKKAGRLLDGREWNEFPMSEPAEVG
jgi:protein gp37